MSGGSYLIWQISYTESTWLISDLIGRFGCCDCMHAIVLCIQQNACCLMYCLFEACMDKGGNSKANNTYKLVYISRYSSASLLLHFICIMYNYGLYYVLYTMFIIMDSTCIIYHVYNNGLHLHYIYAMFIIMDSTCIIYMPCL